MPTVSDFRKNLKMVDVKSLTTLVVEQNQNEIVNLNREDQIFKQGVDSQGRPLPFYSMATQAIYDQDPPADTRGENKPFGESFNLFWSGDSYHSFFAYVKGDKLYITTSPRGRKLLLMNGGEEIFGLTTDNTYKVNWEIIAPKLNEAIRQKLF
jgi:hypothetical protein